VSQAYDDAWPAVDEAALRSDRWERVRAMMRELDLDHLVLTSADAIRYACGTRTYLTPESREWFALVLDRTGAGDLFVPYQDTDEPIHDPDEPMLRSVRAAPAWAPSSLHPETWSRLLAGILNQNGARRVGFEGLNPTVAAALGEAMNATHLKPIESALYGIRREKLPVEVQLLEAVAKVTSRACEAAIDAARDGVVDHEILAAAADHHLRAGVEALSHGVCNVRKPSGDWYPYGAVLEEGDAFMFDIGCFGAGGYASDLARVGFVGEPLPEVARAYAVLLDALRTGEDLARPGTRASAIHAAVNSHLDGNGCATTPYAMCHGVGLRICEAPTLAPAAILDSDATLRVGDVIALEPETVVEARGKRVVLKVEDTYVVEENGLRRLSDARY